MPIFNFILSKDTVKRVLQVINASLCLKVRGRPFDRTENS